MDTIRQRRLRIDMGIGLGLMAVFLFIYVHIDNWVITNLPFTISPADFPRLVTGILVAMSALMGVLSFRALFMLRRGRKDGMHSDKCEIVCECDEGLNSSQILSLGCYIGILLLYLAGIKYIGFVYSTPISMFLVARMLGLKNWIIGVVCYIIFTLTLNYFVFEFMHVILPAGMLFE